MNPIDLITTTLNTTPATDLSSQLRALHAVKGLKDADITTNTSKNSLVRTTSTAADQKRLLRNATRQARRRTRRLEARLQQESLPCPACLTYDGHQPSCQFATEI